MRKLVMGLLLALVVTYRVYLWVLAASLAARGQREEALFTIFADPLGRIELGLAGYLVPHSPALVLNLLCLALWLAIWAGLAVLVAWVGYRRAVNHGAVGQ